MSMNRPGKTPSGENHAPRVSQLDDLFLEYGPKVYGLAIRCGLDPQEAEDGVQEVFLKVQRRMDTFRGEAKFSTWLYQVAMNTLLDHRRKVVRQTRHHSLTIVTDDRGEVGASTPEESSPDETASLAERKKLVRKCLDRLPIKFREVLILRELEGMPYRDISRILKVAQGTVESRIFRARERLATELRKMEESL
jgi:RNA polymerase sigma-70 factor (ECF subfamily)